jgi:hypothetical protein
MSSYVITGAARGIGVSFFYSGLHASFCPLTLSQLEFVSQLSANSSNTIFALVRNKSTAAALSSLSGNNITILETELTDVESVLVTAVHILDLKCA